MKHNMTCAGYICVTLNNTYTANEQITAKTAARTMVFMGGAISGNYFGYNRFFQKIFCVSTEPLGTNRTTALYWMCQKKAAGRGPSSPM